ncbi:hypothetical protein HYV79_04395 [Candidatus Woesearchaeota archaeon]|nr:hypothetical protein [Candidatus Woesearchaeota archaeon]
MNKKAAIELSITGVVVLIIAITILGLILGFVYKYFTGIQIPDIAQQQRERVLDEIEKSGELLNFRGQEGGEVRSIKGISVGSPKWFALGIKNTATNEDDPTAPVCYRLAIYCVRSYDPNGRCTEDEETNALVGGLSSEGDLPAENWYSQLLPTQSIRKGQKKVSEATMSVEKAQTGLYEMELRVYKAENNADCDGASFTEDSWKTRSFTVEITG